MDPGRWDQESPWIPVLKERTPAGRWRSIPWERLDGAPDPDWRIFARSASDSKGPIAQFLVALSRTIVPATATAEIDVRLVVESDPDRLMTLLRVLVRLHGGEPVRIRTSGGSIPISPFVGTLGVPAVSVPTVNPDNNQHSPNENLRVGDFLTGIGTILSVLLTEPVTP